MGKQSKLRNLIIGNGVIASRAEFKRVMLTGYMVFICMAVTVIYAIMDTVSKVYYALPAYAVLFAMCITSLGLLRRKKYQAGKIILLLSTNLVIFWSALNDPLETGVFLFFIPVGIGSFVIVEFARYKTGIALAALTAVLFLVAYLGDIHLMDLPRPSLLYIRINFVFNYFLSLTISMLAIYFLTNLNRTSEYELMQKENLSIQKNIELKKVNEALDRFVYSVSHDLRSPLSSILGLINVAKRSNDPQEIDKILDMIQGRVHAQDHFIQEIIDYSRNTRTEVLLEPVSLHHVVDDVIDALKFNNNADKITFSNSIPENLILDSDRIRLSIILSNLIGNAIKYHDFRKENPFIAIGYREDLKAIYVQDNGTGIKEEHKDKIFNMFYRGSDRSTGSGLGLFITKEAVAKLQGRIEVTSVYGEGSTFTLYLGASAINA